MKQDYLLLKQQHVVVVNRIIMSTDHTMFFDLDNKIISLSPQRCLYLTLSSFLSPFYIYWYFKFKKLFISQH